MIGTVFRIGWLRLRHSWLDLMLTFIVPIVFFSIFALIFGETTGGKSPRIRLVLVDEDDSELSRELAGSLRDSDAVRISKMAAETASNEQLTQRERAISMLRSGAITVAVVLPDGLGAALSSIAEAEDVKIEILTDGADRVAPPLVSSLVERGMGAQAAGLAQQAARRGQPAPPGSAKPLPDPADTSSSTEDSSPVRVEVVDILARDKNDPVVAMYAAGIAVLFLLFTASGTGGSLLEEQETGTLERLLVSRLGMTQLLLGKWLWLVCLGIVQVTVMFLWGQLVFGVDLVGHWQGFAVMTATTAAAAASFALVLATACRTRNRLNGISLIVILSMSALGGSMVPRYVMSESMRQIGLITFNAWALDGYDKVFWRDLPPAELGPQVGVLSGVAIAGFAVARLLARRWERQ